MGKTIWARSLGNHAYFGGLFSLDENLDGVEYAIFDDFGGIKFLPSYKFWLGHQKQFYVTDKYKGKSWYTGLGPQFGYLTPTHVTSSVLTQSGLMPTVTSCT